MNVFIVDYVKFKGEKYMDFIVKIYALFATVPIFSFILFNVIINFFTKSKKIASNASIHLTSFLLIGSVSAQIKLLFNFEYSFIIVFVWIFIIIISLALLQFKIRGYINYSKVFTSASKLFFIFFNIIYLIFFIIIFIKI